MRSLLCIALPSVAGLGIFRDYRRNDPEPWACYRDDPSTYLGTVSVAATGQKCMHWRDAASNPDITGQYAGDTKNEAPGTKIDGNFCRAFGEEEPWCYVLGFAPGEAKQQCDVPVCPTDGPWSRDLEKEAVDNTIKCTDDDGNAVEDCDCSCDGVAGTAQVSFIQKSTGMRRWCHCGH